MNYTPFMPRIPGIREPGLPAFEPGIERYKVSGGGAVVLSLFTGDRIAVIDREGRQSCEIAAFGPDGHEDLGALALDAGTQSAGIARLLAGGGEDARTIAAALSRRGLPRRIDGSAHLLGGD